MKCVAKEPIDLKKWHHFAVTYDGEILKLLGNGEMIDSKPFSSLADSTGEPMYFGANWRGNHLWEGRLDEVASFDEPLSDEEFENLLLHSVPGQL